MEHDSSVIVSHVTNKDGIGSRGSGGGSSMAMGGGAGSTSSASSMASMFASATRSLLKQ